MNGLMIEPTGGGRTAILMRELRDDELDAVAGGATASSGDGSGGCWTVWTGNGYDWNCFWIE